MADRGAHLKKVLYRFVELIVQKSAVGNDNDRFKHRLFVPLQHHKLVRKPCYRVRFAATRRMLDQVPLSSAVFLDVREQPTNDIELMIPRENLLPFLPSALRVCDLDDLGVILNYVGETFTSKNLLPQIIGL